MILSDSGLRNFIKAIREKTMNTKERIKDAVYLDFGSHEFNIFMPNGDKDDVEVAVKVKMESDNDTDFIENGYAYGELLDESDYESKIYAGIFVMPFYYEPSFHSSMRKKYYYSCPWFWDNMEFYMNSGMNFKDAFEQEYKRAERTAGTLVDYYDGLWEFVWIKVEVYYNGTKIGEQSLGGIENSDEDYLYDEIARLVDEIWSGREKVAQETIKNLEALK